MCNSKEYPKLWAFLNGAFSANSGGKAKETDLDGFTDAELRTAERELTELCGERDQMLDPQILGMLADDGYTIHGQTMREAEADADDEQHKLMAYVLLDQFY